MAFEYKIVPAPSKGARKKGVKTPEARFAAALEDAVNDLAADGWEFIRTETLPSEERKGLTGSKTVTRHLLVFKRRLPRASTAPIAGTAYTDPDPVADPQPAPEPAALRASDDAPEVSLPSFSARREDPAIARPVRNLFAERDNRESRDTADGGAGD